MLFISFLVMFAAMYLNVNRTEHIYLITNRIYMTILMITPMSIIMLVFMPNMYTNKKVNTTIYIASAATIALTFTFQRNQTFIGDRQYLKAMIPHHSSAILTSSRANLKDPQVRQLVDSIINSQREEIKLMKRALERL